MTTAADRGLYRWEWVTVFLMVPLFVAFGWIVVHRSAHSRDRMTDYGVYTRSAWAVRTGQDPYTIADDRGWHYCYPPPFVALMVPLADPPNGVDRAGYLPFDVNVAIWYALSVFFAAWAVHRFALALIPEAIPFSRRWWYLRLMPFDLCIGAIGFTLSRGQVNTLTLALLAEMFLAARRNKQLASGWWLAAAGALKVIPGLLVLFPLLTKQWRIYAGMLAGLIALLVILPMAVWGVEGGIKMNREFLEQIVAPGVAGGGNATRDDELMNATSTDSQAFHAIVHNIRHPDSKTRPADSDGISKAIHYALGFAMIGAVVFAGWRIPNLIARPAEALLVFGGFCIVMVHLAPASHMHYYAYSLPTVAGLIGRDLLRRPHAAVPSFGLLAGLITWSLLIAVCMIDNEPVCVFLREMGLAVGATLGLWGYTMSRLLKLSPV